MTTAATTWLGLDIGGANLKAAHTRAGARSVAFPLWKHPDQLPSRLAVLVQGLPPARRYAVTMTAELCDCYATKADGVRDVLEAVRTVLPEPFTRIWGIDGAFHNIAEVMEQPAVAAAANWLALATVAARLVPVGPGLLIDIGSTTTDLIPLRDGRPVPTGRTDTERLRNGELVYAGVGRTPFCALATELPWRDGPIGLVAELFATTRDVYVTLGDVCPDPADRDTADGGPRTVAAARGRLARMIGADRDGFPIEDALELSLAADAALTARLVENARRVVVGAGLDQPCGVVVSGSGAFLARRVACRVVEPGTPILALDEAWGPTVSEAACAYALTVLAAEQGS